MKKFLNNEQFIEAAIEKFGDKFNYSKVEYNGYNSDITIICPKHGEFITTPNNFLKSKCGCKKCAHRSYKYTTKEFVEKCKELFPNKFEYSKVNYINSHTNITVTCPKHNDFQILPTNLLRGEGCPECKKENNSKRYRCNTDEFIKKAKKIHGDKYDYSKVNYINNHTPIKIICPMHGEFELTPINHLKGEGCRKCKSSHLETEIRIFLYENNILFEEQKTFEWLRTIKKRMLLDFYLPESNTAIECQGEQHFNRFRFEKDDSILNERINRDRIKFEQCQNNEVKLLYYSNKKYADNIITDKNELLKEILSSKKEDS